MSVEPRPDSAADPLELARPAAARFAAACAGPWRWKSVAAGFSPPADDYVEVGIRDLNEQ